MKQLDDRVLGCIEKEKNEAASFCESLVPVLQSFDTKKLRLAKVKINKLLFDMEYPNED